MPRINNNKNKLLRRATASEIVEAARVRGELRKDVPNHYSQLVFGDLNKKGFQGVFNRNHVYNWFSGKNNYIQITRSVEEVAKQHQVDEETTDSPPITAEMLNMEKKP